MQSMAVAVGGQADIVELLYIQKVPDYFSQLVVFQRPPSDRQ